MLLAIKTEGRGTREMAQQVKALAALSSSQHPQGGS